MKLYTGRGDFGNTNLIGGSTVKKTDSRVHAYGEIDELNSHIGLLRSQLAYMGEEAGGEAYDFLFRIQHDLFDLGTALADKKQKMGITITEEQITCLEQEIDKLVEQLEPLTRFVLPGGSPAAAQAHICRTVTRRTERSILLFKGDEPSAVDGLMMRYINRLSDYFFVLARFLNDTAGVDEPTYDKTGDVFHND